MSEENKEQWAGDVLNRKPHADFLTRYINSRTCSTAGSLTIALDAGWGAGKTFFVQHWKADLEQANAGVLLFDAWKNDSAVDPVVGFMAELQAGTKPLEKKVLAKAAASSVRTTVSQMSKSVRKALLPTAAVIGAGILKKTTGIGIDAIVAATSDEEESVSLDELTKSGRDILEKSLDAFFKKTLEDHRARVKASEAFRTSLAQLVDLLRGENAITGPLFIFIDELDRCRPDYAIRLLEGIKHLFAVPGVVFVVSTNLDQLAKSIQAVYGPSFDGETYLKRFFDFEVRLPKINSHQFARLLNIQNPQLVHCVNAHHLPGTPKEWTREHDEDWLSRMMALIADSLDLSLRDSQQAHLLASAAATGIPAGRPIHIAWLYFLACLRQRHKQKFEQVRSVGAHTFGDVLQAQLNLLSKFSFSASRLTNNGRFEAYTVTLADVMKTYQANCRHTLQQVHESSHSGFPGTLFAEMVSSRRNRNTPEIAEYFELIDSAGLLA